MILLTDLTIGALIKNIQQNKLMIVKEIDVVKETIKCECQNQILTFGINDYNLAAANISIDNVVKIGFYEIGKVKKFNSFGRQFKKGKFNVCFLDNGIIEIYVDQVATTYMTMHLLQKDMALLEAQNEEKP